MRQRALEPSALTCTCVHSTALVRLTVYGALIAVQPYDAPK